MKYFVAVFILMAATAARAADEPASEASIRDIIEVTQSQKLMDGMMAQMDDYLQTAMKQAAGDVKLTPKQQVVIDDMRKKMVALLTSQLSWETFEPDLISIYQKSFTEQEILGALEFYRTKAGQAFINKMPIVMQNTMELMQKRMAAIGPKMQKIQKEFVEQMKTCCATRD